jgi:hypothetical protein
MTYSKSKIRWRSLLNMGLLLFILISFFQNCAPPQKPDTLVLDSEFARDAE